MKIKLFNTSIVLSMGFFIITIILMLSYFKQCDLLHCIGDILLLQLSVLLHEFGHLIVINKLGYSCDNKITLHWFGGFVKITKYPINVNEDDFGPISDWKIAVAGPMTNLILCLITHVIIYIFDIPYIKHREYNNFIVWFAHINMMLAIINMIPILGLDGCHVLRYILSKFIKKSGRVSSIIGLGLLVIIFIYIFLI